jgi:hypothetical protein
MINSLNKIAEHPDRILHSEDGNHTFAIFKTNNKAVKAIIGVDKNNAHEFSVCYIENNKTKQSSKVIPRSILEKKNWRTMRYLDVNGITKRIGDTDRDTYLLKLNWKVYKGTQNEFGLPNNDGIGWSHGTDKKSANNIKSRGFVKEEQEKGTVAKRGENSGLNKSFITSNHDLAQDYVDHNSPDMIKLLGHRDDFGEAENSSRWNTDMKTGVLEISWADKEHVVTDHENFNDTQINLNHRELLKLDESVTRDESIRSLRRVMSRNDIASAAE